MSSSAGRKLGRGGAGGTGRGRGRGRGGRQGRSSTNNQSRKPNNTVSNKATNGNAPIDTSARISTTTVMPEMKDEVSYTYPFCFCFVLDKYKSDNVIVNTSDTVLDDKNVPHNRHF
jgi:hypothetical protein